MKISEKIKSIINFCNGKTGKSDTNLTAAVKSLGDGYGVGSGITPTGSINITENGIYDVTDKAQAVVNVASGGGTPTAFTNLLKSDDVTIYINQRISTSTAGNFSTTNGAFTVELPLKNWGNANAWFRVRGLFFYNNYINYSTNGTTWNVAYWNASYGTVVDEYGDRLYRPTAVSSKIAYRFSFSVIPGAAGVAIGSVDEIRNSNIIMTVNEPIGNAGIV